MIPDYWQIQTRPTTDPHSIVKRGPWRISVLTTRLMRIEFDRHGHFEDRPSLAILNRHFPTVDYTISETDRKVCIDTGVVKLFIDPKATGIRVHYKKPADYLYAEFTDGTQWHYGQRDRMNLRGTARTLDGADGPCPLEPGLLSRSGWSLIDDGQTPVFDRRGWPTARSSELDIYLFAQDHDYQAVLADFRALSGATPMMPRFILGNWWSRAWAYTQQETLDLVHAFNDEHGIPTSVCVIDMWWHPEDCPTSEGWTGYSWDREMFPDPQAMLDEIHAADVKVTLNLHPHEGVHPHEDAYGAMAKAMDIDPEARRQCPLIA